MLNASPIRASFSQERVTYVATQDSLDGIAKVIYESKDVKTSKTFEALDWLAQLSEIWGLQHMQCIENVHVHACKRLLDASGSACNDAIMSDLGRFPIYINAAKKCIKYWMRLVKLPQHRYPKLCYEMLKFYDSIGKTNWVTSVRKNLYMNGFGYIWEN